MRYGVLFSLMIVVGCGTKSPGPTASRSAAVSSEGGPKTTEMTLVEQSGPSQVGPSDAEWETERISQQIGKCFKQLSDLLTSEHGISQQNGFDARIDFVADDFSCGSLRPTRLTTVHEGRDITVRRWPAQEESSQPDATSLGRSAFRLELASMIEPDLVGTPTAAVKVVRSHFKVASITKLNSTVQTGVVVQWAVECGQKRIQCSANWQCRWILGDGTVPTLTSIKLDSYEEVSAPTRRRFVDVTGSVAKSAGDFAKQFGDSIDYWYDRLEHRFGIISTGYQGIAVADVNGDGLEDVFIPQPGGVVGGLPNRLLIQQADGTVVDRSAESRLDWLIETHSALFVDFDNDGDQDIVVATVMGLVFAANDGNGVFEKRATKLTPDAPPMSLAAADFDDDQDVDLYVCCYAPRSSSPLMGRPMPYHDANNGGRNLLLRNDRDWRFRDVTMQIGMDVNNRRFSFAASWEDFDNDGDVDIYVANDYGRNNLFENDGGKFRDVAAAYRVEDISAGMSAAWGDFNRDGWMDLYVSNMWSSAGKRIAFQRSFQSNASDSTRAKFQRHARGNSFFVNRSGADRQPFEDVSAVSGTTMGRWAWCSKFADINNDGFEDLLVANGFITQEKSDDL